jgi:hypothetical protein
MTTVATQPIKDFISEVAFNEWKAGLIAKAKSLLPSIISESYKAELDLDQANDIANQLFSKLQNTNEKAFKESLDLVRSLISAYSFQTEMLSLVSQPDFIEKKKDELRINYLEKRIDLNCDAWTRLLSELHPMMFELADRAFKSNMTQSYITDECFSKLRYASNKFSFFDSSFNWEDFCHSYSKEEEYCLKVMPQLLEASIFNEEKVLKFLNSVLQWGLFNSLQIELVNRLNGIIEQNDAEKVPNPVIDFNINSLPSTQLELGLEGVEVRVFLKTLFNLISLTDVSPTGEFWSEDIVKRYNNNPSKNILILDRFNISVSKPKSHYLYSNRKLKVKYAK